MRCNISVDPGWSDIDETLLPKMSDRNYKEMQIYDTLSKALSKDYENKCVFISFTREM